MYNIKNFQMTKSNIALALLFLSLASYSQMLRNGPMVGYSSMRESVVWVQLRTFATAQLRYWNEATPTDLLYSQEVNGMQDNGYTAHLIADRLEPGTTYKYEIIVNGQMQKVEYEQKFKTQTLWQYRTDAPPVKFVAGSCFYINDIKYDRPGKPYGGDYEILSSIYKDKPEFMVWLGDNTYLREADLDSKSGIYYRYTHTRNIPELKPLMANTHHYAIWDDHDYGPNDCNRSFVGKEWTLQAFKDFWANPTSGAGQTEGITTSFSWADADFFMMDNRWYRTTAAVDGQILGDKQLTWLIESLQYSKAKYKFVCIGGQVLNSAALYENYANYSQERQKLLDAIDKNKIKGVVFMDGDRHHSEISKWTGPNGINIYDVTSSSLTSGSGNNQDEKNDNRIKGSMISQKNYAVIEIVGPKDKREVNIVFKDTKGVKLFEYKIAE